MMRWIGRYTGIRKRNIFIRFFAGVLLVSTVAVSFMTAFTFRWFQNKMLSDIEKMKKQELLITGSVFEEYITRCQNFAMTLYRNSNLKSIMLSDSEKREWLGSYSHAVSQVQNIMAVNSFINSIYIINPRDISFFVSNCTESEESQQRLLDQIRENTNYNSPFFWNADTLDGQSIPTLSVYFCEKISGSGMHRGAIVINMNLSVVGENIFQEDFAANQQIMIVDRDGQQIISSSPAAPFSDKEYAEQVIHGGKEEGSFPFTSEGTELFVSYISVNNGEFFLISEMEYDNSMESLIEGRNQLLLACFCILLIIIAASFLVSHFAYQPVSNVYDNMRALFHGSMSEEEKSKESNTMIETLFKVSEQMLSLEKQNIHNDMVKLLHSGGSLSSFFSDSDLLKSEILSCADAFYMIIVIRIDKYHNFLEENNSDARAFRLSAVRTLAAENFQGIALCSAYQTEEDTIALILSGTDSDSSLSVHVITAAVQKLQYEVRTETGLEITAALSSISRDFDHLSRLYLDTYNRTKTKILYPSGHLFDIPCPNLEIHTALAEKEVKKVLQSAKSDPTEQFLSRFENLLILFRGWEYPDIIKLLSGLAVSMNHITDKILSPEEQEHNYISIYEELSKIREYEELLNWFRVLHAQINSVLTDAGSKNGYDIVQSSFDIISREYADTQLSVNSIAERFSISSGYYSRIFNEITGYTFPDYINNLRLEKAAGLLLSNRALSIREIALSVGYSSESYFSSSFKKKYGISPSKYRHNTSRENF